MTPLQIEILIQEHNKVMKEQEKEIAKQTAQRHKRN